MKLKLCNPRKRTWETIEPIFWEEKGVCVPTGFKTDLASTPRFMWSILPPYGSYTVNAIIHDYVYTYKILPRDQADSVFFVDFNPLFPTPWWEKLLLYIGVRLFGWFWYYSKE